VKLSRSTWYNQCYVKSAELKLTAPAAESRKRITIWLGKKRYAVDLTMKAEELKPKPAPLIPLPIDGRKKGR